MDLQFFDATRIGIEHFEFDASWVTNEFAACRDAAEHREDERPPMVNGVDIGLLSFGDELYTKVPLELFK